MDGWMDDRMYGSMNRNFDERMEFFFFNLLLLLKHFHEALAKFYLRLHDIGQIVNNH